MADATVSRPSGRGKFISFEGGEGSGKSTQIRILAERLDAAKLRAIVTREPGGSPGAEIIRHLLLSGMGKLLGPEAETLLFAAARCRLEVPGLIRATACISMSTKSLTFSTNVLGSFIPHLTYGTLKLIEAVTFWSSAWLFTVITISCALP